MSERGIAGPERAAPGSRVLRLLLAALCAGYATGSVLGWGSARLDLLMGHFGLGAAAAAAAISCFLHARHRPRPLRAAWLLFALSSAMAALGDIVWGCHEAVQGRAAAPPLLAGLFLLCFAPPAIVGLLMLARRPATRAGWACLSLDAWLVGGSLLTLSWSFAVDRAAGFDDGPAVAPTALSLALPLLETVLVGTVLVLRFRRSSADRPAICAVIAALTLTVLCDTLFGSPLARGGSHSSPVLDACRFAAAVLLAYAPWMPRRGAVRDTRAHTRVRPDRQSAPAAPVTPASGSLAALTPYLAAAVCMLGILYNALSGQRVDRVVLLTAGSVVMALVARQAVMLLDSITLAQELARKENLFRSLVQGSSDVIMIAAPSGVLRYVSPAASGVYGRDADELVGSQLASLIHPMDLGLVVHELRRFLAASPVEEPTTRIECRFKSGTGAWLTVESTINRHHGGFLFNSRAVRGQSPLRGQVRRGADTTYSFPGLTADTDRGTAGEDAKAPPEDRQPTDSDEPSPWSPARARERYENASGGRALQLIARVLALLLPADERHEWVEEQRGYLADLPGRRAQWAWIVDQLLAMPRYAYTVRSGRDTGPA